MAACGLLVILGLVAIVRWGDQEVRPPPRPAGADGPASLDELARRYAWHLTLGVSAGAAAGILMAGPGGRLVMRLLAATAGDGAQGRLTEAEEVVGRITTSGTIVFVVFVGIFGGVASGLLYAAVRRWLPGGRLGGLAFGALLLVVFGQILDPLRRDNPDFDVVGPGWLAVAAFGALVLAHGMLVAAVAGRYSRSLAVLSPNRRTWVRAIPLAPLLLFGPIGLGLVAAGAAGLALARVDRVRDAVRSPRTLVAGRIVLTVVAAGAMVGFVATVIDITGRGP
jgi:hypothetical protein